MQPVVIYLVGPGGAGKSTVGPLLALLVGARFLDLDQQVCERVAPIPELVERRGYRWYCEANADVARQLAEEPGGALVVATSSGFLAHDDQPDVVARNLRLVRQTGRSILILPDADLDAAAEIIARRQVERYAGSTFAHWHEITARRLPLYRAAADVEVCSGGPAESVAAAVEASLHAEDA